MTTQKVCSRCKTSKSVSEFYFKKTRNMFNSWCKACCKEVSNARHKGIALHVQKSPEEHILNCGLYRLDGNIRAGCYVKQTRGKPCEKQINTKYLRDLYHKQGGKCYYTGVQMKPISEVKRDPYLMSLDRIDSFRGYVPGNVVLCCLGINWLKNTHSESVMLTALTTFYEGAMGIGKIKNPKE